MIEEEPRPKRRDDSYGRHLLGETEISDGVHVSVVE